jgi:thiamine-phosphate pyrophosphorylase
LKTAARAGVDIIQLRDKTGPVENVLRFSEKAKKFLEGRGIPYIINDRVDVALACGASGVHLGQDDLPVAFARKMLGAKAIIGVSCQQAAHARRAVRDGADYIGFGSVFKTKTKPERSPMDLKLLKRVIQNTPIPVFAIGGVSLDKAVLLASLGAGRAAVCRAVCESNAVAQTVKDFQKVLRKNVS